VPVSLMVSHIDPARCKRAAPYGQVLLGTRIIAYISTSCRWISAAQKCRVHKKAGNSSDFRARQIFQVGHHVEVPQLCFFCVNASSHMTVNPKGLCRLHQHI